MVKKLPVLGWKSIQISYEWPCLVSNDVIAFSNPEVFYLTVILTFFQSSCQFKYRVLSLSNAECVQPGDFFNTSRVTCRMGSSADSEYTLRDFTDKSFNKIKPDVASIFVFYPYPGTELYDYCIHKAYFDPDEPLPRGYISRRSSLLNLQYFSRNDIERCFQRFGFRVFKDFSLIKAIGYALIYSKYGEFLMRMTVRLRNIIVKLLPGF